MKNLLLVSLFLTSFQLLKAQQYNNVDQIISNYPKSFSSPEKLAEHINKQFDSDEEKARAIYTWIARNVKYDVKALSKKKKRKRMKYKSRADRAMKLRKQSMKIEDRAISENKAQCKGYSALFKRLCDLTGLYSYIIPGTSKSREFDIGKPPKVSNHAWNAVQIDKKWYLVDATFGAGSVDFREKTFHPDFNDKYFFTPPEKFFLNHYPKEKSWLLTNKNPEDFANLPLYHGEFLKTGFELDEPNTGIINIKGIDTIQVKIKADCQIDTMSYSFNYEKEPHMAEVKNDNGLCTFDVVFPNKRRGYLTLFHEEKAIVTFKVNTY